jgi:hypothetical protein
MEACYREGEGEHFGLDSIGVVAGSSAHAWMRTRRVCLWWQEKTNGGPARMLAVRVVSGRAAVLKRLKFCRLAR